MPPEKKLDFASAIKKIETLHGNMSVLAMLSQLLHDTNSNLDDVTRLIKTDGALTTTIIRISNSAFYGSAQKNTDVPTALQQVGLDEALRLVGVALSRQVFMKDLTAYGITADYYWTSSYFCGLMTEKIARRAGLEVDEAYLLGLLHSIGKVVINEILLDNEVEIYWDPTLPSEEWEDIMVGFRHSEAGALLLTNWAFSEFFCDRIKQQAEIQARSADPLLEALDFARIVSEINDCDLSKDTWDKPQDHPIYQLTEDEALDDDIKQTLEQVAALQATLKEL